MRIVTSKRCRRSVEDMIGDFSGYGSRTEWLPSIKNTRQCGSMLSKRPVGSWIQAMVVVAGERERLNPMLAANIQVPLVEHSLAHASSLPLGQNSELSVERHG